MIVVYVNCSFISRIEDVMNRISLMEMFKCSLNICLIGYYILTVR